MSRAVWALLAAFGHLPQDTGPQGRTVAVRSCWEERAQPPVPGHVAFPGRTRDIGFELCGRSLPDGQT